MNKASWMMAIVLVGASLVAVVPSAGAAEEETVEHEWWELGKDYVFTGNPDAFYGGYKYVRVNNSDVLTVNWKSGNITTYPPYLYIYIYAIQVVNYSGLADPLNNFNRQLPTSYYSFCIGNSSSPPKCGWVRFGAPQVVKVEWWGVGAINVTLNVTVSPGEDALASKVAELEGRVAELEGALAEAGAGLASLMENLSSLEGSVSDLRSYAVRTREMLAELNTTLSGLTVGLQDGQDGLWENLEATQAALLALQEEMAMLGLCETADYQAIQGQLAALNASLMSTLGALREEMGFNDTALREGLEEVQNRTVPEPEPYNDSALWAELAELRGNVSTVYNTTVNNTTIQQPVTYVNRTIAGEQDGSAVVGGAAAGVVVGVLPTLTALVLYDRRMKKRYGGVSTPAAEKI